MKRATLALGLVLCSTAAHAELMADVGIGCSMYRGTALNLEVSGKTFHIEMSVWGDGLSALRRDKKVEVDGSLPQNQVGRASFCLKGRTCENIKMRLELTQGGIMSNNPIGGRLYWYEPTEDKEVSVPFSTTVKPNTQTCY